VGIKASSTTWLLRRRGAFGRVGTKELHTVLTKKKLPDFAESAKSSRKRKTLLKKEREAPGTRKKRLVQKIEAIDARKQNEKRITKRLKSSKPREGFYPKEWEKG